MQARRTVLGRFADALRPPDPESSRQRNTVLGILFALLGLTATGLYTGFIQRIGAQLYASLVSPWLPRFYLWLTQRSLVEHWVILALASALGLLSPAVVALVIWLRGQALVEASAKIKLLTEMMRQLGQFDRTLVQTAFELYIGHTNTIQTTLAQLFEQALRCFVDLTNGEVFRACVLAPDQVDVNRAHYLIHVGSYHHDNDTTDQRFYIGPAVPDPTVDEYRSGIAGLVFRTGIPVVVHFNLATHAADRKEFVEFAMGHPDYWASMVAVPIYQDPQQSGRIYGVLCLDSRARRTFDTDVSLASLAPVVRLISHLMILRERVSVFSAAAADAARVDIDTRK